MADVITQNTSDDNVILKAKGFWAKNQKPVSILLGIIIVLVGGWYVYNNYIVAPKEQEAEKIMYKAEEYFRQDSLKLALNGDQFNRGFVYIINNYGSTKAGNLAKYYAGVCYLRTSDFNKAVNYLNDFSTDAKQIQMMAYGALGDAYSELNKNDDAINYYKKAANEFTDDATMSSEYLFRAALKLETLGKNSEALDLYKELKEKYPTTERGNSADKYIYRLSIIPNDFSAK